MNLFRKTTNFRLVIHRSHQISRVWFASETLAVVFNSLHRSRGGRVVTAQSRRCLWNLSFSDCCDLSGKYFGAACEVSRSLTVVSFLVSTSIFVFVFFSVFIQAMSRGCWWECASISFDSNLEVPLLPLGASSS